MEAGACGGSAAAGEVDGCLGQSQGLVVGVSSGGGGNVAALLEDRKTFSIGRRSIVYETLLSQPSNPSSWLSFCSLIYVRKPDSSRSATA